MMWMPKNPLPLLSHRPRKRAEKMSFLKILPVAPPVICLANQAGVWLSVFRESQINLYKGEVYEPIVK